MQWDAFGKEDNSAELKRLGAQLKALREAQGLTYDDVSDVTHVRPHVIQSIENGTIEETSAPVYARGFIKTYCEYLMASDLWRKYSHGISSLEDSNEINADPAADPAEIMHPTPVFRRSSIIWVYMILVTAVLGAAYLLWSQQRDPGRAEDAFSLRFPATSSSGELPASDDAALAVVVSEDVFPVAASGDEVSMEALPIPVPNPAPQSLDGVVSRDLGVDPGDLSWMDETSASARPLPSLPQLIDKTLLIEITGSNNKLTVEQEGKVVTRRTLNIGGRRSYDVTSDTKVAISSGNKARVTWFGKRYDSIGSDNASITLIFHPDGTVSLVSGKSPHFGPNGSSENI
ncbi:MAG: helix-turn-helix domain-containing protein [Synergistaceae bacterium]|jgi:transcriptional regulator with XRE-family HTH domain|nr:helix-turn-helix domain-containing protein [Synergistaceae bacterium]